MCQSHTGRLTGLWFLPKPAFGLNTDDDDDLVYAGRGGSAACGEGLGFLVVETAPLRILLRAWMFVPCLCMLCASRRGLATCWWLIQGFLKCVCEANKRLMEKVWALQQRCDTGK